MTTLKNKTTKEVINSTFPFVFTWVVFLLFLAFILSVVSCDCEPDRPTKRTAINTPAPTTVVITPKKEEPVVKPEPTEPVVKPEPAKPVVTTVINNYNDNTDLTDIESRLKDLEGNDDDFNDRLNSLDGRLLELEAKLNRSISDTNGKLSSLYEVINSIDSKYLTITQQLTLSFETLCSSVEVLGNNLEALEAEGDIRFNQLISIGNTLNQTVINLQNQINTVNVNVTNVRNTVNNITVLVTSIQQQQNNQLTIQQVQNIALSIVNGNIRFINPCELTTRHTELVFVIGVKVYAFVVEGNARGGLAELVANLAYGSTIGCQCSFKYNVVNNQVVITKL
jgi:hypothetical protein